MYVDENGKRLDQLAHQQDHDPDIRAYLDANPPTEEELALVKRGPNGKFVKGSKFPASWKKTTGIAQARKRKLKDKVYQELRDAINNDDEKETFYSEFLKKYMDAALKNTSGPEASFMAKTILSETILDDLDTNADKGERNDTDFMQFKLIKTVFDKQRDVLLDTFVRRKYIIAGRRAGKCFGYGTKIRMFDGSIKEVQDLSVGDVVMGSENEPQVVMSTNVGQSKLYNVIGNKSGSRVGFTCNEGHILTLQLSRGKHGNTLYDKYEVGKIYDMPIEEYLSFPDSVKECWKLWRQRTEYQPVQHVIPPYILGLWLGDGHKNQPRITCSTKDPEVMNKLEDLCKANGWITSKCYDKRSSAVDVRIKAKVGKKSVVLDELKRLGLKDNKHIPEEYLIDSIENRLELLAGLIDSDGYLEHGNLVFANTNKTLIDNVCELVDSLGYRTSVTSKVSTYYGKACKTCYQIHIKGALSEIPNVHKGRQANDCAQGLGYGFHVEDAGYGNYYGLTLSGNGRFLLSDYLVVHNTDNIGRLLYYVAAKPNMHAYYINLTFGNAMDQMWELLLKVAQMCDIEIAKTSQKSGDITLTNGSQIHLRGNATVAEQEKFRGFKAGLVIVDEAQSQRGLKPLIEEIIEPMLMDYEGSMLVLQGTPPRVPDTYFEKLYREYRDNPKPDAKSYNWNMLSNPFIPNVDQELDLICERKGVTRDDPIIQREYLGVVGAYDIEARMFSHVATYEGTIPESFFSEPIEVVIGVDYGFNDYNSVIGMVFRKDTGKAYLFYEDKFNKATVTEIITSVRKAVDQGKGLLMKNPKNRLDDLGIYCDTNEKSISYEMVQTYSLPAYNAWKYDKNMALSQLKVDMQRAQILIPKDGVIEDETKRILYKRDKETDAILDEIDDDVFHPDALMALLYASRQYYYEIGHDVGGQGKELT